MRNVMRTAYISDRRGFALESTLIVLLLMSTLAVIAFAGAVTNIRTTNVDYRNARVTYAAEAGAEAVMAQLDVQLQDGVLTDAELAALTPPVIPGFTVDSFRAAKVGGIVTETITNGAFAGMYSLTQNINIHSAVRDASNDRSAVVVSVKAQAIPIFQFAAFWEGDFEDYAWPRKDVWGRVHGNGNMYLGGNDLHFHDVLTTPGKVRRDPKNSHNDPEAPNVYISDAGGSDVRLDFDSDEIPGAAAFRAASDAAFDGRLKTDAYGVDSLKLPIPDGVPPRELIRPREASDTDQEKEAKFAWQADMYVTVDLNVNSTKGAQCGSGSGQKWPAVTVVRYDGGPLPTPVDKCDFFDFAFEAFYNNFEDRWIDPFTVRLNKLRTWLTTGGGSGGPKPDVIYVEFKPRVGSPFSGTSGSDGAYYPALRLKDGSNLYGRLTIGSEYPLYVQGNYNNTSPRKPAAAFGDALTMLSNDWDDSDWDVPDVGGPTYQWFGLVTGTGEGYYGCWHHTCSPPAGGGAGWVRNLEAWDGELLFWRGSFVSLWAPVHTCVNCPSNSSYTAPQRDWSFDPMFLKPDSLPPATPVVGNVIHTAFRPVY